MDKKTIPWVEKYRPNVFENIILDDNNRELFKNILATNNFPNLLLHGPPGIGKTTTIINLINKYKKQNNEESKTLVIHLNASDERGIDIIRNTLQNFVVSDNLFTKGTKFVILDEVDYMTRIAQQALKCLMQEYNKDIKYCLICNYISKIDYSLQYEFIKVRFNKLAENDIYEYLNKINKDEKMNITKKTIHNIINGYDSDIRSMINFMQSNIHNKINILDNDVYDKLYNTNTNDTICAFNKSLNTIENKYKLNKRLIIKNYITYILNNKLDILSNVLINEIEYIIHNLENENLSITYVYYCLNSN
jgi:DNA polymerase III delta prime subunit